MTIFAAMKRIVPLFVLLFSAATWGASAQQLTLSLHISNPSPHEQQYVPVVVALSEIDVLDFDVRSAHVEEGLPCQLDDMDGDGVADELVLLLDMDAEQERTLTIVLSPEPAEADVEPLVYADMMLADKKGKLPLITALEAPGSSYVYSDLYHHGPAFESEITAYRIYFDHRQNIDIYGKKQRRLELPDTHFYTTAEQLAAGYGNDVLWAGSSIACGSLKLWDGNAPADWRNVDKRMERIVSSGPLRTVVEVADIGVLDGNTISTYYIIYGGHRDVEVVVHSRLPLPAESLCTGVQKVNPPTARRLLDEEQGLAATWGTDYPEQSSQANKELYPPETVGLAVYVPESSRGRAVEDSLNVLFTLSGEGELRYYISFCADKEEEDGFHSAEQWFESLTEWVQTIEERPKLSIE